MGAPDCSAEADQPADVAIPSTDAIPSTGKATGTATDVATSSRYSSSAMRLRAIPITMFATDGTLSLADGRLVYAKSRGRVVLDMPLHELHSVMRSPVGFHIWHGERRLKFAPGELSTESSAGTGSLGVLDLAAKASNTHAALADYRAAKGQREEWLTVLPPLVGAPPTGLRVAKPWPAWAWAVMVTLFTLAVIGGIVWYSLATPK